MSPAYVYLISPINLILMDVSSQCFLKVSCQYSIPARCFFPVLPHSGFLEVARQYTLDVSCPPTSGLSLVRKQLGTRLGVKCAFSGD
jgi:hypothetical protein